MPDRFLPRTLSQLGAFRCDLGSPLLLVHSGLKGVVDDTIDALETTVDEEKGAAEVAAERSELALRRLEDKLQNSSRRQAAQARASTLALSKELRLRHGRVRQGALRHLALGCGEHAPRRGFPAGLPHSLIG